MGRSFDRGGQSRKERERGKRRNYRQAERDREARDALVHAKRTATPITVGRQTPRYAAAIGSTPSIIQDAPAKPPVVAVIEQKRPGLLAQMFGRLFKKSA